MNFKTIIYGCAAVGIAASGALFNKLQHTNEKATYVPRVAHEDSKSDFAGYAEYINSLRADPITGEVDMNAYNQVKQEMIALDKKNNKAALGMNWISQGPDNVGGRTRAVLIDNSNSNIIYAGSIGGGLYVSTDGAGTWSPIGANANFLDNTAISCITQTTSGRIFFGTGSSFETISGSKLGTPGFTGNGVYEYVPSTGQILPVLVNSGALPNNNPNANLSIINAIAAKGERLYVGTKNGMIWADPTSGTYPTTTAGWLNPIHVIVGNSLLETGTVLDIDVASNGSMVVCFGGKVYHSFSDADDSFTRSAISGSRLKASIAPSDPNYIYVVSTSGSLNGLYLSRTFDSGNKPIFDKVVPGGAPSIDPCLQNDGTGPQCFYDLTIGVDPNNRERCIVGGIQLYEFNLIPTSVPLGGDWVKIAHLSEFIGAPSYMHADKHTMVWSGNTIYVGNDGGVYKSSDNGVSWSENNLGYNVTTFFSAATNALGWILGGAQDNGDQMVSYGAFGGSLLSAIQVQGGDGFDAEFSNFGGGIAFATSQSGVLTRSSAGGQGSSFFDDELAPCATGGCNIFNTTIAYWESEYDPLSRDSIQITFDSTGTLTAGQIISYPSLTNGQELRYTVPTTMAVDTTDTLMFQDYIQHKMAYYSTAPSNTGVFVTRQAASLGAATIDWFKVANTNSAYTMEFTPDGNSLFIGTSSGVLVRVDNLSMANDSLGLDIRSGSSVVTSVNIGTAITGVITGIAVDPNNGNNVIVTVGGYTSGNHVYRSTNALTGGTFIPIQGPASPSLNGYLPKMPVYEVEIDYNDKNQVILGTEWGTFSSTNAFTGSATTVEWYEDNNGMGHVPVFDVRQQIMRNIPTSGRVFLGTHGKGFYASDDLMSITAIDDVVNTIDPDKFVSDLTVYPNPLSNVGIIAFNLQSNAKTIAKIYSLTGKLVKTINYGSLAKGDHNERFDATSLSIGSYIVSVEAGDKKTVAKFVVTR